MAITNIQFIKQDINDYKSAEKFDTVICQGVLHHIPGYQIALEHLKSMLKPNGMFLIGLYHPWGKALQKLMPKDYNSLTLQIDQEEHPFELSFWGRDVKKMFSGYSLVNSAPSVLFNWRNGGLTTYAFRKYR